MAHRARRFRIDFNLPSFTSSLPANELSKVVDSPTSLRECSSSSSSVCVYGKWKYIHTCMYYWDLKGLRERERKEERETEREREGERDLKTTPRGLYHLSNTHLPPPPPPPPPLLVPVEAGRSSRSLLRQPLPHYQPRNPLFVSL